MAAVRVTKSNVHTVMNNTGIDSSMLMKESDAKYCGMSNYKCRDACDKYGLSSDLDHAGNGRGGACILYRLYNIVNDRGHYDVLYAPEHLTIDQVVGEL